MNETERAREIVDTFNLECPHGFEVWGNMRQRLEADIAAALAAQAAQTRQPLEGLGPLGGLRVQTCSATCSHDLRCSELEAAHTRALREALQAAHGELWRTYGDTTRLRPLFDQMGAAL